jgi:hypothetical protein
MNALHKFIDYQVCLDSWQSSRTCVKIMRAVASASRVVMTTSTRGDRPAIGNTTVCTCNNIVRTMVQPYRASLLVGLMTDSLSSPISSPFRASDELYSWTAIDNFPNQVTSYSREWLALQGCKFNQLT